MNISNALRYQLEQFGRIRSAHLNEQLKEELSIHYKSLGFGKLNKACSTCVRIAMDKVNANIDKVIAPKIVVDTHMTEQPPKLHFVGIKTKTFKELRNEAKEKGFIPSRTTTRQDLEEFLSNE